MDSAYREEAIDVIYTHLEAELFRLGNVNPQFSYYERLTHESLYNEDTLHRVYSHITKHGGFAGL